MGPRQREPFLLAIVLRVDIMRLNAAGGQRSGRGNRDGTGTPCMKKAMSSEKAADDLLRSAGLRRTTAMRGVLSVLLAAGRPLSRREILQRLRGVKLDPVTAYRCLMRFTKAGMVHRTFLEDRAPRFETADRCAADHCHPHFTCRACGETTCMESAIVSLAHNLDKGYVAERQKVLIEGICAACAGR